MSDPVSNHDIEDVLSSIRRLVAQGNKENNADAAARPAAARPVAVPESSERLVLTADFRVSEPAIDSSVVSGLQSPPRFAEDQTTSQETEVYWTEEVEAPVSAAVDEKTDRASLEATIAELEAAVTESFDEWEPDGSEVVAESSVTSAFLHKLDARQTRAPEETVTDAVTDHIAETIADEIAQNVSFEEVRFSKVEAVSELEPVVDDATSIDHDDVHDDVKMPDLGEPTFSHSKFSEVYDPVAEATADAAEKEDGDVYGDELAPDDAPTFGAMATPTAGQLVDPDALRAMVGEMIREELQGEMGERITRNVRKLVRREINRVITEQDV